MGSNDKQKAKQDYLSPTKIERQQNKEEIKFEKNLSDHELQKRLDLYSKGDKDQFFKIQRIKQDYLDKTKKDRDNRTISDLYYSDGRKELLPHSDHRVITDTREELDQNYRDHVVREAKAEYRKHDTLSKLVNEHSLPKESYKISPQAKEQKSEIYKNLSKLMAEYGAVSDSHDRAIEQLKHVKLNNHTDYSLSDLKPDRIEINQNTKSLSSYFDKYQSTPSQVRETFNKKKNKDKERDI